MRIRTPPWAIAGACGFALGLGVLFGYRVLRDLIQPESQQGTYFAGGVSLATAVATTTVTSQQMITLDWPSTMNNQGSDFIKVAIVPAATLRSAALAPQLPPFRNRTLIVATPIPIGTPGASLGAAFGRGVPISVAAQLAAPGFDTASSTQLEQRLSASATVWEWVFRPKTSAWHAANVSLYAQRVLPKLPPRSYLLWNGSVYVNATTSPSDVAFNLLQASIASIIGGVLGFVGVILSKRGQKSRS